jgi:hypothetical protein
LSKKKGGGKRILNLCEILSKKKEGGGREGKPHTPMMSTTQEVKI